MIQNFTTNSVDPGKLKKKNMKHETVNWVFTVMADLENILSTDKLFEASEALQDLRIILAMELSKTQKHNQIIYHRLN